MNNSMNYGKHLCPIAHSMMTRVVVYFIKHFNDISSVLVTLTLFLFNINVVYYTTHTIPLLGLAKAFSHGSFFLDSSYCKYVDTVLVDNKCIFVAPPGLPLILSPFLKVFSSIEPLVVGGFVVAVFGFLAVLSSWAFTSIIIGNRRKALFYVVVTALAGPLWVYSTHIFPQAPIAFTYTFFTYLALKALRDNLKNWEYVLAGFLASLTVLFDPAMVIAVVGVALVALIKLVYDVKGGVERPSKILLYTVLFLLGATPAATFYIYYNTATTGSPLSSPEFLWLEKIGVPNHGFTTPITEGLYILLLDVRKGLIPLCPVFILALLGIPYMLKAMKSKYEKIMYLLALVLPLVIHAAWYDVDGGLSFGPRLAVPVTMLLAPPLAYATRFRSRRVCVILWLLVLYGVLVNSVTVTVTPYPSTFEDLKPYQNQFLSSVIPRLSENIRSSNLYTILKELGEPLSTITSIALNFILSVIALVASYRKVIPRDNIGKT